MYSKQNEFKHLAQFKETHIAHCVKQVSIFFLFLVSLCVFLIHLLFFVDLRCYQQLCLFTKRIVYIAISNRRMCSLRGHCFPAQKIWTFVKIHTYLVMAMWSWPISDWPLKYETNKQKQTIFHLMTEYLWISWRRSFNNVQPCSALLTLWFYFFCCFFPLVNRTSFFFLFIF